MEAHPMKLPARRCYTDVNAVCYPAVGDFYALFSARLSQVCNFTWSVTPQLSCYGYYTTYN